MNFSFLILRSPEVCSLGTNIFSRLLKKRAAKKPGPGLDRQDPLKGKAVSSEDLKTRKISRNLKENKEYLVGILGRNVDLVTREINPGGVNRTIWLVYLETLADNNGISESILKPLMLEQFIGEIERPDADFIELIENSIITAPQIRSKVYTMDDVTDAVMSGTVALFVDGCTEALLISLKDWPQRGVYFFVDPAEPGPSAAVPGRVVRVGTHALKTGSSSTLWRRLSQHRGQRNGSGNHRGSVFRLHVGRSLIARDSIALGTWGVGSSATPDVRAVERELEERVSGYLAELLVTFVPVLDEPGPRSMRGFIERNSIGSLSAARDLGSGPSDVWLGWHAPSGAVQESGLWNVRHVGE